MPTLLAATKLINLIWTLSLLLLSIAIPVKILYAKNADKTLPIASMTKLVTVYLTLQAIKNKKLSWDQKVKPTAPIVKVANNTEYSNVHLKWDILTLSDNFTRQR